MKHHHHHHHHHAHLDDPGRDAWQRPAEVVAAMELSAGMTVADLGAGTGYFLPYLSRAVGNRGRVLALDVDLTSLRQRHGVEVRAATPTDPALEETTVDRILIVDVWHHLGHRVAYAQKLRRALKPGGRICIVDAHHDAPEGPPPELRLSAATVLSELSAAGFDASVVLTLPKQFVVLARPR